MSLNLYDLLDVEESAGAEEIRAAWKSAIADLDPTDRRFRAYNDAAAVLLDPAQREAYDARLAEERAEEPAEEPVPAEAAPGPAAVSDASPEPVPDSVAASEGSRQPRPVAGPPSWSLWVAAFLAVVSVVFAVLVVRAADDRGDADAAADVVRDAGNSAQLAARDVIVPLLGYDYRTMDEDLVRIQDQMTEEMAARQARSWEALTDEARKQKIVVSAEAPYVALTRVSDDGDRATVVVFIDQYVEKADAEPFTLQMWATLTMVRDGDDWLLDDICTEGDCG